MSIRYTSGWKYRLEEAHSEPVPELSIWYATLGDYIVLEQGVLHLARHYAWDGPSGPAFDTKKFMRPSLVHDAIYQLIGARKLPPHARETGDKIMRRLCVDTGMWWLRRKWVYWAVRNYGPEEGSKPKPVIVAP